MTAEDFFGIGCLIYMAGFVITIFFQSEYCNFGRRIFLWPAYWIYTVIKFLRGEK